MARVRAAGGVLWRPGSSGPEVAVVHRPRYDDWSLPKGKLDAREHPLETAVREVHEETGHRAVLGRALGSSSYRVLDGGRWLPKTVQWWAARSLGGDFRPGEEVDALRWLPPPQACDLLTAGRDVEVLGRLGAAPLDAGVQVLVRHGHAGRRKDWSGEDDQRPLDTRGRRQADRLAGLLPLLGVTRLVAAPLLRCVQTLEPLAARLGVAVELEPLLSDAGRAAAPEAALDALLALGAGSVACSQGDAVPALVHDLAARDGRRLRVKAHKGAGHVLSLAGGRLLAADPVDPEQRSGS